jgi:hypothetical protein
MVTAALLVRGPWAWREERRPLCAPNQRTLRWGVLRHRNRDRQLRQSEPEHDRTIEHVPEWKVADDLALTTHDLK